MSDGPPRLLFVCQTLPYPPDGGVWIRSYHTLRELSRNFSVTALCFERSGSRRHDVEAAVRNLSELAPTEAFPVPQEESLGRKLIDHLRSLLSGRVFTVYKHRCRAFRRRLRALLADGNFDLVHMDSLDLSTHLPLLLQDHPVSCVHHNVESRLLGKRADAVSNPLVRWYLRRQAEWQREEEQRWCARVDMNVTVSEDDRDTLQEIVPDARVKVIPNGVDVEEFAPEGPPGGGSGLVFVGASAWFPNRDGMKHFCRHILPRIRDRVRKVPLTWVGSADDELRMRLESEFGVRMTGYVDDIRPHVRDAACFIVPIRVGGGSRVKILDAWALGKAVVSTEQGCEGLRARDGENILVRNDPDGFARAVTRVLKDETLRKRLGQSARETAVEWYSWRKIGREMNRAYQSLIE